MENNENMIEFISGKRYTTVTFTNLKHINKIKKLYETNAEDFKYYHENEDGSICAKIPLKWIKISLPRKVELTEEQRQERSDRMRQLAMSKNK